MNERRQWKKERGKRRVASRSCYLSVQCLRMVIMHSRCPTVKMAGVVLVESMSTEGKATNLKGNLDPEYEAEAATLLGTSYCE
jgi:hypothetical protein